MNQDRLQTLFRNSIDIDFIEYLTSLVDRYSYTEMGFDPEDSSNSNIFFNFNTTSNFKKYTSEEYDLSTIYYNHIRDEWLESNKERINAGIPESISTYKNYIDNPSLKIQNILLDYFYQNEEMFPSINTFIDLIYNNRCLCSDRFSYIYQSFNSSSRRESDRENNESHPRNYIKNIIIDFIMLYSFYPSCNYFAYYIEFFIIHNRIPSDDELSSFIERAREFNISPEDFHQKDKLLVPTLNIKNLLVQQFSDISNPVNDCCAICREDFSPQTQTIKLSPCNHLFHSNDSECLQDASIANWLHAYNFCPLCKTKIDTDPVSQRN